VRWFFDTEFIDTGHSIDLISIGMVNEEGQTYEACFEDGWREDECGLWLQTNVLPKLPPREKRKRRYEVAEEIVELVGRKPEFWSYFGAYDWVALCQLVAPDGRLLGLPKGDADWPHICFDLKMLMVLYNFRKSVLPPRIEGTEHGALSDALWVRDSFIQIRDSLRLHPGFPGGFFCGCSACTFSRPLKETSR
jgi:hypothetical protein